LSGFRDGVWSRIVKAVLMQPHGKNAAHFPDGMSEAERASIVSTALFATRWRDLGDDDRS